MVGLFEGLVNHFQFSIYPLFVREKLAKMIIWQYILHWIYSELCQCLWILLQAHGIIWFNRVSDVTAVEKGTEGIQKKLEVRNFVFFEDMKYKTLKRHYPNAGFSFIFVCLEKNVKTSVSDFGTNCWTQPVLSRIWSCPLWRSLYVVQGWFIPFGNGLHFWWQSNKSEHAKNVD